MVSHEEKYWISLQLKGLFFWRLSQCSVQQKYFMYMSHFVTKMTKKTCSRLRFNEISKCYRLISVEYNWLSIFLQVDDSGAFNDDYWSLLPLPSFVLRCQQFYPIFPLYHHFIFQYSEKGKVLVLWKELWWSHWSLEWPLELPRAFPTTLWDPLD